MYFTKDKIIIILLEDNALILHITDEKLLSKWKVYTKNHKEILELESYVIKNNKSIVYIIFSPSAHEYQHHNLDIPITSNKAYVLNALFSEEELNKAAFSSLIMLKKKNDHYLSIRPTISSEWINFANNIHKQFKGFSIAALEYKQIMHVLSLGLKSSSSNNHFDVLLMCSVEKQLEITIYHNGVFLKTQFISLPKKSNLAIYTGYIKQSFDSALDHLTIKTGDSLNGYLIVPNSIRNTLLLHNFDQENIVIISAYEASIILGLEWIVDQNENSCSALSAYNIINNGKNNYIFNTSYAKNKNKIAHIKRTIDFILALIIVLFILFAFYINDSIRSKYITQTELIEKREDIQSDINQLLTSSNEIKYFKNMGNIIINMDNNDNKALDYILSISDRYNDVAHFSYDKRRNDSIPSIKIDTKNNKKIKCDDKNILSNLYAEIDDEEHIH